ncbi:MAG TPA: NAD(P)/FAD-dependent oxidoreductase [Thermoanaerobaculia bacterium]|jgi:monoamine oxidase|nr:NAD(P)/FAD-dependent oxidoreductase [Thermoanaerobaculia bacterium]
MSSSVEQAPVLVIGAGMSGVAAAWSLRQAGIGSIVLEARPDRIGGRIWSSYAWPQATVDLGASWMSHLTINPLVEVARANKIALEPSELLNITLTQAEGYRLTDDETAATMALYFAAFGAVKLAAARRARLGKPDVAVAGEFARALKAMELDQQTRLNVEYFINYSVAEANAANLDDLSLYHWDDDYVQTMLAIAVVPGGYQKVVEALAKGLDVRRGHVVSHIEQTEDEVTVSTNHGDFRAPYAIVTLPHGVLAKRHVKFSPPLPGWKLDAIRAIHTGLSDKFWFLFPRAFWKSDRDVVGRVDERGDGRWSTWINFQHYTRHAEGGEGKRRTAGVPILMCFNRTEHALALEQMSDQEVIDEAMPILSKAYKTRVPEPLLQRSRWHADPFAEGTIVHVPPGASSADILSFGSRSGGCALPATRLMSISWGPRSGRFSPASARRTSWPGWPAPAAAPAADGDQGALPGSAAAVAARDEMNGGHSPSAALRPAFLA